MSEHQAHPPAGYREAIAKTMSPVRPLPTPGRRLRLLVPLGILIVIGAPMLNGPRRDLDAYAPLVTWVLTAMQSLVGVWLLTLGYREAVPGRNVSRRALAIATAMTALLVFAITAVTNAASATVVPPGRALRYWAECVAEPVAIGTPFLVIATVVMARAFPTRPAIAGALCGLSAGLLTDAGWRLTCWISDPTHVIGSHALAVSVLAAAGAGFAVVLDLPRWRRLRARASAR
jgi:hypothetical protein